MPLATVGISLLHNAQGWWYVSRIAAGSSADLSGKIEVLDELLNVDHISITPRMTKEVGLWFQHAWPFTRRALSLPHIQMDTAKAAVDTWGRILMA